MSDAAASTVALILPVLLGIGILGPLVADWKVEWPERGLFASQTAAVVVVEAALLFYIIHDQSVPKIWLGFTQLVLVYALIGILVFVFAWAKKTPAERAELREDRLRRRQRRHASKDKDLPPDP